MKGDEVNPREKGNLASSKKMLELGGKHVNGQGMRKIHQKYMKELELGNSLLCFHPSSSVRGEASQERLGTVISILPWYHG